MPLQIQKRLVLFMTQLELGHRQLTGAIGPQEAEGAPVVDASRSTRGPAAVRPVLAGQRRRGQR